MTIVTSTKGERNMEKRGLTNRRNMSRWEKKEKLCKIQREIGGVLNLL